MAARTLLALAALAALVALASSAGTAKTAGAAGAQSRFIDLDPWAWLPTRRTKSASIMDYFFPPSRTPKLSNLDTKSIIPSSLAPSTDAATTTVADRALALTTTKDARTTTASRTASTAAKTTKKSSTQTTPKAKQHDTTIQRNTETKTTTAEKSEKITTVLPSTTNKVSHPTSTKISSPPITKSSSSTHKPTKHYTIVPIRTSATAKPTNHYTQTTLDSTQTMRTQEETDETVSAVESTGGTTVQTTLSSMAESSNAERPSSAAASSSRVTFGESRATTRRFTPTTPETTDAGAAGADSTTGAPDGNSTDELDSREGYLPLRDKPVQQTHVKINDQTKKETVPLPAGSTSVLAKPTKYHYYPHNQHIYLLPECAIQQVCNAVYVRLNYTQPLCACPSRYRDPCSASLNADDLHTTRLTTDSKKKFANRAVTLVKTCEAVSEMRECRAPRDWSLLALQNIRTGKSHYLVICRCPENHILEGPMSHDQPTYASVPGIRVYGMMCVRPTSAIYQTSGYNANRYSAVATQTTTSAYKVDYSQPHYNQDKPAYNRFPSHSYLGPNGYYNRMNRAMRTRRHIQRDYPPFPWHKVKDFAQTIQREE